MCKIRDISLIHLAKIQQKHFSVSLMLALISLPKLLLASWPQIGKEERQEFIGCCWCCCNNNFFSFFLPFLCEQHWFTSLQADLARILCLGCSELNWQQHVYSGLLQFVDSWFSPITPLPFISKHPWWITLQRKVAKIWLFCTNVSNIWIFSNG